MTEGVQRMDELFTQALAAGIVRGDPDLIIQPPPPVEEEEEEPTGPLIRRPSSRCWSPNATPNAVQQTVAQIRGLAGVIWVTEAPLPGGGANLSVNYPRRRVGAWLGAGRRAAGQ